MQTSDLNVKKTESDYVNAIFRQFQDAIFSREHTYVKILQRCHCQKKLPSLLSSEQHFAGFFASEPMTLPEIDHASFFAEHAQTFFAGEKPWYGQCRTRAHNHITRAVADMDSSFALVGAHQHGIDSTVSLADQRPCFVLPRRMQKHPFKVPITFFFLFSYLKLHLIKITSAKKFCDLNQRRFF